MDDAAFLKRTHLDLTGAILSVSETRDYLEQTSLHRRGMLVDRLLNNGRRPEKYSERTAAHRATVWRRMMVPGNSPEALAAIGLEPWLKDQFATNVPYEKLARKLITAKNETQAIPVVNTRFGITSGGPPLVFQTIGGKPETAASSVSRVFLGVRMECAECHNHPFASWKQQDFWGLAAFFNGIKGGVIGNSSATTIRPENGAVDYTATFLGSTETKIPKDKTPREALADWVVSGENSQFAATVVNRVWQHLIGRRLTDAVDDLDTASPAERRVLDDLAKLFVEQQFDMRWLIAGICTSQLYQRECVARDDTTTEPPRRLRPITPLSPEQVFDSLEKALSLPVARADGSPRFNGRHAQLISRMNEAASNNPEEFRAGPPQTLLLMNGRLTTEATDLDQSRTLRGVLDALFLDTEAKLTTLYLATFSRPPRVKSFKVSNDPRFAEKRVDVVGRYLNPPENSLVLSCDEKSPIQSLDRTQKRLPLFPGRLKTLTHDYKRNGTTTLFAAIELAQGRIIAECLPQHRIRFLKKIDAETPPNLDLHLIIGNYATHKHPNVLKWLKRHRRFHIHFTPTNSSWLNVIERSFHDITQDRIRNGVFRSVAELEQAIRDYIAHQNAHPKTFVWTKKAEDILAKVTRARASLNKIPSE